MDQPGKVAHPARGQLNRENEYFPVPVRAGEFGFARQVRPSRPAPACSLTLRLNPVLTHGIPPDFRGGVHVFIPPYAIGSGIPMAFTIESPAVTGPVVLKKRILPLQVHTDQ